MKIINQWIVGGWKHLIQTEDGKYYLGIDTNFYSFQLLTEEEALRLLAQNIK